MSRLDDIFVELFGEHDRDAEKQRILRVAKVLGVRDNDAILPLMIALEHYKWLYEEFPQRIEAAAKETLDRYKEAQKLSIQESAETTKRALTEAVKKASLDVARSAARKQVWQWAGIGVGIAAIALAGTLWVGFQKGLEAGLARGYAEARDEKAAATWVGTPEGKMARRLAKAGDLEELATCENPGWLRRDGYCFVQAAEDGKIRGWKLPEDVEASGLSQEKARGTK